MNWSLKHLFFLTGFTFIIGIVVGILAITIFMAHFKAPKRYQQKMEAISFFYRTMHDLFEGTYSNEGISISPEALKIFKEYEHRLGGKCDLIIYDSTPGYYECAAFFPSGDVFTIGIVLRDRRWLLGGFHHRDWQRFWSDILYRYRIEPENKQRPKETIE